MTNDSESEIWRLLKELAGLAADKIAAARARLAELRAQYAKDKAAINGAASASTTP